MQYPEWDQAMSDLLEIKSPCLKPVAEAFHANMMRTAIFALMPADITWLRIRDMVLQSNAHFLATGEGVRRFEDVLHGDAAPGEMAEFEKQARAFAAMPEAFINSFRWKLGVGIVETTACHDATTMTSLQALYTSVILESWLFFEALCADLWVAAVDNATKAIAARVALAPRKKQEDGFPKVDEIEANFKTHPGSFWREAGIVTFQKRRDIEDNLSVAFGTEIKALLQSTAGGYVWALNAFRNCITHSVGKVDAAFQKQAAPFPEFRDCKLKSMLKVDGALAAKLRNAALLSGAALLKRVDEMLVAGN